MRLGSGRAEIILKGQQTPQFSLHALPPPIFPLVSIPFRSPTRAFRLLTIAVTLFLGSWLPGQAPLRVMPLGDSITKGHAGYTTWRFWLWNDLLDAGYNVDFVGSQTAVQSGAPGNPNFDLDHEGYWGWTSGQVVPQVLGWAQAAQPDVVTLHLGTNDLAALIPINQVIGNISQIILNLRSVNPNVTVLLAQIIPTSQIFASGQIPAFNAQVLALAQTMSTSSSAIIAVDHFTGFSVAADTWDGIHPNESGGERMAANWLLALTNHLPGLHLMVSTKRGPNSLQVRNLGGPAGDWYLTVVTTDAANAGAGFGTGWFGGLHIAPQDVLAQYQTQAPPFFGMLDSKGASLVNYPPGTFPSGPLMFYAIGVALSPNQSVITGSTLPRAFQLP